MRTSRPAVASVVLASVSLGLLLVAGPGARLGLWGFRFGFTLLTAAVIAGSAALLVALVAAFLTRPGSGRRGLSLALSAAVVSGGVVAAPLVLKSGARKAPPIHDVSTDTEDPPAFIAVLPLRTGAPNPATPAPPDVVEQQRRAYPDLGPLLLDVPPATAFDRALSAARRMGWTIVAEDRPAGRIEATATTFWFGFRDDVVVRLRDHDGGTRIDARSVSRVGRGDAGTNAARIRSYFERIRAES